MKNRIYFLPNLFTMGNLFCGFYSIIASIQDFYVRAAFAVVIGGVLDSLDGKVARLMKQGESKFGAEFDSLTDLITFGLAPAMLMYMWSTESFGRIGWLACFVFVACGALRLARFNSRVSTSSKKYFEGLPIPAAAGMMISTTLLFHELMLNEQNNYFNLILTMVLGALMVSNIKFRSFKEINFKDRKSFRILAIFVFILMVIAYNPSVTLFTIGITYISAGLIGELFRMKKSPAKRNRKTETLPSLRLVDKEEG